ncbi:hypothetical protein Acr_07g0017990 [Actinidia rufa]|uniref:Uncharacterized protein n=1 Tax=Actinidia rufa TaxID=165716 RepID=A0A7J0EYZ7_9ERIC|nr:hypothetical protein Acr_07g0017990 [Actinidia rufa]
MGGLTIIYSNTKARTSATLFCNYFLLGANSSCIFFTLSFSPHPCGFFLIILHFLSISGAVYGCTSSSTSSGRWGFSGEFLKSYVREEDGSVILKLAGGLYVLIFCLEWVVLILAFFLKYYANVDGGDNSMKRSAKVQQMEDEDIPNPPLPHHLRCRLWMHLLLHFLWPLGNLKSYVREEDGSVILKLAGGLSAKVQQMEDEGIPNPPRSHHIRCRLWMHLLLHFLRLRDFLGNLKSYVREEDGSMILKLAVGLRVLIFCLEWVVLTLAFFLKYYANVGGGDNSMKRSAKVQQMEDEDFPSLILSSVL